MPFATVDEYIGAQPMAVRRVLARVRDSIRKAVPEADESISYRMLAYKLDGRPVGCEIDEATARFPFAKPVPATLIGRIARFRADEIAAGDVLSGEETPDGR